MSCVPHLLPYVVFLALGLLGAQLPDAWGPAMEPVRAVAVLTLVGVFYARGAYPELRPRKAAIPHATLLAIGAGVAVGLAWPILTTAVPTMGAMGRGGFDANAYGGNWAWLLLGARLTSSIVAVPFAEELLVRSLIPRWTDAGSGDWRQIPVGKFTAMSFAVSVAFFTVTHPEWLAALLTGLLWTYLLIRTRRLRDIVMSHAVANAVLDAYVLVSGDLSLW